MFKSKFSVELRNRFEVLEVKENINKDCKQVEKVHTETAEKVLDRVKKKNKKTPGKQKTSMKSEKVKGKLRLEYMLRDREVKHRAREEKRVWLEQIGSEAEKSAGKGRTRELYEAARKITNKKYRQVAEVKRKNCGIIKDKDARLERWAGHFEKVLVIEALTTQLKST